MICLLTNITVGFRCLHVTISGKVCRTISAVSESVFPWFICSHTTSNTFHFCRTILVAPSTDSLKNRFIQNIKLLFNFRPRVFICGITTAFYLMEDSINWHRVCLKGKFWIAGMTLGKKVLIFVMGLHPPIDWTPLVIIWILFYGFLKLYIVQFNQMHLSITPWLSREQH